MLWVAWQATFIWVWTRMTSSSSTAVPNEMTNKSLFELGKDMELKKR